MKYVFLCIAALFLLGNTVYVYSEASAEQRRPTVSEQRVVFSTSHGDLVFAFYQGAAPEHMAQIIRLVRLGLYNSVKAFRIIPGFIVQFEEIRERGAPFSREQSASLRPIKAEFSSEIKHLKGRLSMARWGNNPDSAVSSFSVLLGDAPHLDGKYTVFGFLESGGSVINKMLSIPLRRSLPSKDIYVINAYVVNHKDEYYGANTFDAEEIVAGQAVVVDDTASIGGRRNDGLHNVVSILIGVIIAVSLLGFFLQKQLNKSQVVSLLLVNILISTFTLVIVLLPRSSDMPWMGVALFVGIFVLFRLMSNFEKKP